jgi:hypothetical protein
MSDSPTWEELDAIRAGKSDIDLAERIWQLERQLASRPEALPINAAPARELQSEEAGAKASRATSGTAGQVAAPHSVTLDHSEVIFTFPSEEAAKDFYKRHTPQNGE